MAAPIKGQLNVEWYKLGGPREESYIRNMIKDLELEQRILAEAKLVSKGVLKSAGTKDGSDGVGLLYFEEALLGELAVKGAEIPDANYFAMVITGYITPEKTGKYKFRLISDDQSRLKIGDKWVVGVWGTDEEDMDPNLIGNNGYISEQDKTFKTWDIEKISDEIELEAGKSYPIRVEYWDGWGGHYFNLKWSYNGEDMKIIDSKYLSADPLDPDETSPATYDVSILLNLAIAGAVVFGGLKLRRKK